jgi:hypothetical protein
MIAFLQSQDAGVAQLVEHFLAKEDVASSSLVTRLLWISAKALTTKRLYSSTLGKAWN